MLDANRRTFQKVRRNSALIGTVERDLWAPTNKGAMRQALRAARRYNRANKAKGRANGPLGHVGLEVYEALWGCVSFASGRLEPSLAWLQEVTGRSRAAVVAALKRLKVCGFVSWRRRLEYADAPRGVRGPQVRQATNAYRLAVPGAALALLPEAFLPDDEITRLGEVAALHSRWANEAAADSPLGKALARFGRFLGERESAARSESLRTDFSEELAAGRRPAEA